MDIQSLIDYYTNLLIIQYNGKPKARAIISLFVEQVLSDGIIFDIQNGFNILTAVGVQLDMLGKLVGVDRTYIGQSFASDTYFSFCSYFEDPDPAQVGLSTYATFDETPGKTLNYSEILTPAQLLSDDEYRVILQLKIIQNTSNHSHGSLDASLYSLFNGGVYFTESIYPLSISYYATSDYFAIANVALQKGILPRPAGIRIEELLLQDKPYFAFGSYFEDSYPSTITGLSTYDTFNTTNGKTLKYENIDD